MNIKSKSLDELDPPNWGPPNFDSHVVTRCHELRGIPIEDFETEDLRLMIGQEIGLKWLIPIAINRLQESPLAEGDYYEGDLLGVVLEKINNFPELYPHISEILNSINEIPDEIIELVNAFKNMAPNKAMHRRSQP